MAKHKFAYISLTVRDRAISSKYSIHRVSKECTLCNFQKILPSPKMTAILNFRIFANDGKTEFYCGNTSYPMDNCFTGRRDRSRQTSEKDVLFLIPAGLVRRAHSPGGASYFLFLSRQRDVIASFSFGAWRVKTCFLDKRIFCSTSNATFLFYFLSNLEVLSTTMSSPGQRRGSCGHAMAGFNSHSKCARCRDKGLGDDPCVQKKECAICRGFTPEQTLQLSTPTYRDRKDKKATTSSSAPTLVDPAHVSVLGKVEKVKAVQSTLTTAKKMKCSESPKPSANKKKSSSSRPSAEDLKQLDDKWAERFFRLEAMLLAKTFTVPVEPVVKPASDVTPSQKPCFFPGATTSKLAVEKSGPCLDQATGEAVEEMQTATQPLGPPGAGIATQPVQAPGSFPEVQPTGEGDLTAASDSEADQLSVAGSLDEEIQRDRSAERDVSRDDPDSEPTEEANYMETMRGVRSFMNWHKVPEFETVSSTADDNPFAGARAKPTGKVSVKLPVDDWLCRKMSSLNLTLTEGYPTRNTDNTGLLRDQFIKTPRSSRWYGMHAEKDSENSTVRTWSPDPAKLNHSFSRVARRNLPTAPPSRAFNQDLLRRWERAAREQTLMCNQAAGLSRCLTIVQDSMATQLKTLRLDSKGKSSEKMKQAVNELEYLTTFNRSVSQAMAKTMQDLSEGVFINMANFPLARRDSYLDYLHSGVKLDTVNAL